MARAVYQYELTDADFSWLLNSFQESHPEFQALQSSSLPIVFIKFDESEISTDMTSGHMVPPNGEEGFEEEGFFPFSTKK